MNDELQTKVPLTVKSISKRSPWRYFIYAGIIFLVIIIAFSIKSSYTGDESIWSYLMETSDKFIRPHLPFASSIEAITGTPEKSLIGHDEDRINILLLGIGGNGHEGGTLTDTIIIASYRPSTNEIAMMSIPRDLIIPIPGYGWRKINNLYSLANFNDHGTGGDYTKQIISQIFGIQIPYFVLVDFQGFTELIDLIGGIDITVPRPLSDYKYPIFGREDYPEDQRYEHLFIEAGKQHFDGITALKYVRSRHALGEEGSDFARAARQQLVMAATMNQMLSFSTFLRPGKIKKIVGNIEKNIDTNLNFEEIVAFGKLAKNYRQDNKPTINQVLIDGIDGSLQAANYNNAFVLEPKVEDFSELKFIANNLFDKEQKFERPSEPSGLPRVIIEKPIQSKENAKIAIQNGTFVNGIARANQEKLEALGYNIIEIGNAAVQDYQETAIYDLSNGKFPSTLDFLAANYSDNISTQIPLGLTTEADIVIIIGLDTAY